MNDSTLTTSIPTVNSQSEIAQDQAAGEVLPFSFWQAWKWWLAPTIIGFALVLYFVDPFIGDWDGLDYTMLSLAGYPSSMALGRNLFIFGNHALYEIAHNLFNVPPEHAYLIFKYAVVAQTPFVVVACWVLARDVSRSIHTATVAAAIIALSPVFVLYGGQVMTDVPSVLILATALIIHLRGLRQNRPLLIFVAAALLGIGVNLRESLAFYALWLAIAPFAIGTKKPREYVTTVIASLVIFSLCAVAWFAYWFLTDSHYRWVWFGWRESMAQESARHPITIKNLWPYVMYFFITGPLAFIALPFALRSEARRNWRSPLLVLGVMGLAADVLLFFNYSTAVNWRYFLTGLPAITPLSSDYLVKKLSRRFGSLKLALVSCFGAMLAFAIVFSVYIRPVSREFIARRALSKEYRYQLANVPRDAVMISGAQTIAVTYWRSMGLGDWKTIGTGGGWPGPQLVPTIETYLQEGRRVFIDTDHRWWIPCGWQHDEIPAIVGLQDRFKFRRITDTIYELRPQSDQSATDDPNLVRLLPENRPEDMKKCLRGQA